jgi:acyl carrier protein
LTPGGLQAQRRFAEQGIDGFSPDDGLAALEALFTSGVAHAAVLNADRDRFASGDGGLAARPLLRGFKIAPGVGTGEANPDGVSNSVEVPFVAQYRRADATQRPALLQKCIGHHIAAVLKLDDQRIDIQRPLGEYGLNSIMGLELRHRLERDLALRLSATLIWNYPSVAAMAGHLGTRLDVESASMTVSTASATRAGEVETAKPSTAPTRRTKDIVDSRFSRVEEISDDDALQQLRAFRGRKARDER